MQGVRARESNSSDPNYIISGSGKSKSSIATFKCKACSEFIPRGISLELKRLSRYLKVVEYTCTNNMCENHHIGLESTPSAYQKFGKSRHGTPRYRCKLCKKTFSIGKSTRKHKAPHKNAIIFGLLINKMPLKRIMEVADVSATTLYGKIDFIHRQCLAFIANRERKMMGAAFVDKARAF